MVGEANVREIGKNFSLAGEGEIEDPEALGQKLAEMLLKQGAAEILRTSPTGG